jgi:hypothetical protein
MPIRIIEEGKYCKPVIACDHCGQLITDVRDGNYQWRFDSRGDFPGAAIYFTHKRCCHPFEQCNPGEWGAEELDCLFVYLANNLDLDWEAARTRAWLLDDND